MDVCVCVWVCEINWIQADESQELIFKCMKEAKVNDIAVNFIFLLFPSSPFVLSSSAHVLNSYEKSLFENSHHNINIAIMMLAKLNQFQLQFRWERIMGKWM